MKTRESSLMEGAQEESEPPSRSGRDYLSFQRDLDLGGPFFVLPDYDREEKILNAGLQIEVIRDIAECQRLWEEFSPKDTLFECWEFRLAFYNAYKFEPYFILLKKYSENLALLLWNLTKRTAAILGLEVRGKKRIKSLQKILFLPSFYWGRLPDP
ncbi:MAG: hypothetical protein GF370_02035 [Candidatus Nealsonbacteria bacterium]|nr:hypothetical protein [Candidatus Nealsonbacteria bacterium]